MTAVVSRSMDGRMRVGTADDLTDDERREAAAGAGEHAVDAHVQCPFLAGGGDALEMQRHRLEIGACLVVDAARGACGASGGDDLEPWRSAQRPHRSPPLGYAGLTSPVVRFPTCCMASIWGTPLAGKPLYGGRLTEMTAKGREMAMPPRRHSPLLIAPGGTMLPRSGAERRDEAPMGLKSDPDFLRNVTMGARASALVMRDLAAAGFRPIELERGCRSNKMWKTRARGRRVPDLLCVRTGIRFEVRGKGALCIRMSDSAARPERAWDAGLRARDIVAIVSIAEPGAGLPAAGSPSYFKVADLRSSRPRTRDAGRKVHGQGAESSIEWPCTVPVADGRVTEVAARGIEARLDDGTMRRYRLQGRHPYVRRGDRFTGGQTIIAGVVARMASPTALLRMTWKPGDALRSRAALDRLCAAKALPHLPSGRRTTAALLAQALADEDDIRVALEMAAALAQLDAAGGIEFLVQLLASGAAEDVLLEAVLILAEVKGERASAALHAVASEPRFRGLEIRQAAVWGLGTHGCADFRKVADFLADADDGVSLHALCALSGPAESCADWIIARMVAADQHGAAAYSAALERIGTSSVLERLLHAWPGAAGNPWLAVTVARMPEELVRRALAGHPLLPIIEPLLMYRSLNGNWLSREDISRELHSLQQQTVFS